MKTKETLYFYIGTFKCSKNIDIERSEDILLDREDPNADYRYYVNIENEYDFKQLSIKDSIDFEKTHQIIYPITKCSTWKEYYIMQKNFLSKTKNEKAKYLMIDSKDMYKIIYKMKREASFNDFNNIYYYDKEISAEEIFNKNGIPQELQKIIIKINIPMFFKDEGNEYLTDFPFDITGGQISKVNNDKYITAYSKKIFHDNQLFERTIKFTTHIKYFKYNEVVEFIMNLVNEGYLEKYLKSLKEIFDITYKLEHIQFYSDKKIKRLKKDD